MPMFDVATLQKMVDPLFPGLIGVRVRSAAPERIEATLEVRPDLCTAGGIMHGGAYMAFADTLGAWAAERRAVIRAKAGTKVLTR